MTRSRAILSVLVVIAIVLAPLAAAWSDGAEAMSVAVTHTASHSVEGDDSGAAAPMEDCASMMKGAASPDDCLCCDKDKACPPEFCMAKCYQFLGLAQQSRPNVIQVAALFRPTELVHPPDWLEQPQPPPPRI